MACSQACWLLSPAVRLDSSSRGFATVSPDLVCNMTARRPVPKVVALENATKRSFDVRFGSEADICSAIGHVRFTPESGHVRCKTKCPLWANSGHQRAKRKTASRRSLELANPDARPQSSLCGHDTLLCKGQFRDKTKKITAHRDQI